MIQAVMAMTDLEKIKLITGESDEALLSLLLEDARDWVLSYTNRTVMVPALKKTVVDIAVIAYNRMGTEGESGRSEAGESYSFADAPASIYGILNMYRLARCGGNAHETQQEKEDSIQES